MATACMTCQLPKQPMYGKTQQSTGACCLVSTDMAVAITTDLPAAVYGSPELIADRLASCSTWSEAAVAETMTTRQCLSNTSVSHNK